MWHWANAHAHTEEDRAKLADALRPPVLDVEQPRPAAAAANGGHHPGLAPPGIPAPTWWKGDRAAFRTSVQAAGDLGYKGAGIPAGRRR